MFGIGLCHTVSVIVQQCGCEEAEQCSSVKRSVKEEQWRVVKTAVTGFSQCPQCGQCDFFQHGSAALNTVTCKEPMTVRSWVQISQVALKVWLHRHMSLQNMGAVVLGHVLHNGTKLIALTVSNGTQRH